MGRYYIALHFIPSKNERERERERKKESVCVFEREREGERDVTLCYTTGRKIA